MIKLGLIYTGKLGDIVGTLPLSLRLSSGYEVIHYCIAEYAGIFKAVSYVKPRIVEGTVETSYYEAVKLAENECAVVLDKQIHPRKTAVFRDSSLTWEEFVETPKIEPGRIYFDVDHSACVRGLITPKTLLVSMHSYSDSWDVCWDWVEQVVKRFKITGEINDAVYICAENESPPGKMRKLSVPNWQLPALMKFSRAVFTKNSAPAWIARLVGVPTLRIPNFIRPQQDTVCGENLVSIEHKDVYTSSKIKSLLALLWRSKA